MNPIFIVNRSFTGDLRALVKVNPVWIVGSPDNASKAREIWSSGEAKPGWLTTTNDGDGQALLDSYLIVIDQHHPGWHRIEIISEDDISEYDLSNAGLDDCRIVSESPRRHFILRNAAQQGDAPEPATIGDLASPRFQPPAR